MRTPLWAGSISASTVLDGVTARVAYAMLKCHTMGAPPMILIGCALWGVDICSDRLLAFALIVCVRPHFCWFCYCRPH